MGLLEEIDKLELSDDAKDKLRQEYGQDIGEKDSEINVLRRRNRKKDVEKEVKGLADLGLDESPGLLKFVRRVYLSDDEQPGTVLLSDADLELSGDEATGSRSEEEISVANAVRKVFELMPKTNEGKLKLSDQALLSDDHGKPDDEDEEDDEQKKARQSRVEGALGRPVERSRGRVKGTV